MHLLKKSPSLRRLMTLAGGFLLVAGAVSAQETVQGYDHVGPYAAFGFSIGETNGDDGVDDSKVQGGFNLRGGYRVNEWVAGEADFIFVSDASDDVDFFTFTFGPKFFPLGFFETDAVPDALQPYLTIAIGGGQYVLDDDREGTFIARIVPGFDYWIDDHLGLWVEGGYYISAEDFVQGTGIFSVGAQYRF